MGRFKGIYILPFHLAICVIAMLAYFLPPKLQFLGIAWVILNIADFPLSGVAMALAFKNGFLAGAWIVLAGTLWWYLLSKGFAFLLRRAQP